MSIVTRGYGEKQRIATQGYGLHRIVFYPFNIYLKLAQQGISFISTKVNSLLEKSATEMFFKTEKTEIKTMIRKGDTASQMEKNIDINLEIRKQTIIIERKE